MKLYIVAASDSEFVFMYEERPAPRDWSFATRCFYSRAGSQAMMPRSILSKIAPELPLPTHQSSDVVECELTCREVATSIDEVAALKRLNSRALEMLKCISDIMESSDGISGWNLNGTVLMWEESEDLAPLAALIKELELV